MVITSGDVEIQLTVKLKVFLNEDDDDHLCFEMCPQELCNTITQSPYTGYLYTHKKAICNEPIKVTGGSKHQHKEQKEKKSFQRTLFRGMKSYSFSRSLTILR